MMMAVPTIDLVIMKLGPFAGKIYCLPIDTELDNNFSILSREDVSQQQPLKTFQNGHIHY